MTAISRKRIVTSLLLASCALTSFSSLAYTLNISVKGSKVTYENAYSIGDGFMTLSDWDIVPNLTPTTQWQPGLLYTTALKFSVSGSGISNVDIPLKLHGAQYGMKSAGTTQAPLYSPSSASCNFSMNGTTVELYKSNTPINLGYDSDDCYASNSIKISENQPFYFTRPIFKLDEEALIAALKPAIANASSATGIVLIGSVPVSMRYYFLYGSTTTLRNLPAQTFTVKITYATEEFLDVEVDRYREIEPVYNPAANTASGRTTFNVKAYGNISSGIIMTFEDVDYEMSHKGLLASANPVNDANGRPIDYTVTDEAESGVDYVSSSTIPYYIYCEACDRQTTDSGYIVRDGKLVFSGNRMAVKANVSGTDPSYGLDVGYENIHADTIVSGLYMDTFVVTFSLDL